ncbi:MAG: hypothetical protein IT329_10450 [Caldilineaceae bacterium]|nr:hypothetical protein [Caldilineaceae bacterium]
MSLRGDPTPTPTPAAAVDGLQAWGYAAPFTELLTITLDATTAAAHSLPAGEWRLARIDPRADDHALLEYVHAGGRHAVGQWFARQADYAHAQHALAKLDAAAIAAWPDRQMLWQLAGVDAKLPGLAPLCRAGGELIVHRPTRRGVVRHTPVALQPPPHPRDASSQGSPNNSAHAFAHAFAHGDNDLYYSKVVRPNRAAKLAATLQAVRDACRPVGIMTPEVVAVEEAAGVVTMTALPGRNLLEIAADSAHCTLAELTAYGRRTGAVLAALHRSALPCEKRHDAAAECEVVSQWLERLAWVAPTLHAQAAPRAKGVFAALAGGGAVFAPSAPLHRDCYDKQFVVGAGDVGLLDFDTFASGEAALDIANLLVHCGLRVYEKVTTLTRAQHLAHAFIEGYGLTNQEAARLSAYADGCRLRLLCVYGCRPGQRDVAGRLAADLGQALLGIE